MSAAASGPYRPPDDPERREVERALLWQFMQAIPEYIDSASAIWGAAEMLQLARGSARSQEAS